MPTVTGVRKERAPDGAHEHIASVCTNDGLTYTRAEVVAGLDALQTWETLGVDGSRATIKKITSCSVTACPTTPYITTAPDHTPANNLDNLPPC